ncbi:hypothetical protein [Frankia sp. ArI3]|uniref:nSTAND1 domain-containing NTPase n=1 Tax=Frankia sp. ArI3 TaxID=1858 RepID=UPI001C6FCB13|nr:hypothetical protein [Frankia sp. ArI3]
MSWDTETLAGRLAKPGAIVEITEDLLAAASPPARRLLLVVDQAEELLVRSSPAARNEFLALLAAATSGQVRAVATLRSEYLDQLIEEAAPARLPVRAEAVNPLSRDLLRLVIAGPARLAGLTIDDE